jgi:hypothetical protein
MSRPGELHDMKLIVVGNLGERELLKGPLFQKVAEDGKIALDKDLLGKEVLVVVLRPVPQDRLDYSEEETPDD